MIDHTQPIDFERAIGSTSWERAADQPVLLERVAWDRWLVTLGDGEDTHLVQLHRDHGAYLGHCTVAEADAECKGWQYHDGPCAHLCAVRWAAYGQQPDEVGQPKLDTYGQPVRIFDAEAVADARADYAIESDVATDGGPR